MLLLALAALVPGRARALDPKVPLPQLGAAVWDREQGLPSEVVRALARGADGLVFVGTELGLVILDGVAVTRVDEETAAPGGGVLPSSAVEALLVVGDTLWIGTPRGLARWDRGLVRALEPDAELPAVRVHALLADRRGDLWVATDEGVFIGRQGRFAPLPKAPDAPSDPVRSVCSALLELPDGAVAMACEELYLYRDGRLGAPIAGLADAAALALGADGSLWIGRGYGKGVGRIGKDALAATGGVVAAAAVEPALERPDSAVVFVDPEGALWVGGNGPTVIRRTGDGRAEELALPDGRTPHGCRSFLAEPTGAMLIGCAIGVVRVSEGVVRILDTRSRAPKNPMTVYADRQGALWLADSDDASLGVFRDGALVRRHELAAPALAHLEARDGTHWIGTPAGLHRVAGDALEPVPVGEGPAVVLSLAEGPQGELWLTTGDRGVVRLSGGVATSVERAAGDPKQYTALLVTRDGKSLWVGTANGPCVLSLAGRPGGAGLPAGPPPIGPLDCLDEARRGPGTLTITLHEDRAGAIWVGTFEHGLVRIAGGRAFVFRREHGLPFDTHYAILEDDEQRFWISGPAGVFRVARAELDAVDDGRAARVEVRRFGRDDGLPIDETNGGGVSASRARDGRLWFATPRGAVGFDPRRPDPVPRSPPALVEELRTGGRALSTRGETLEVDERDLLVRYTAPTFERAAGLSFRHRLDGVDAGWVDAGPRRVAMYNGLPPGRHVFRVAARAVGARDYGDEASFVVVVPPRFTETTAFKLILIALGALALYGIHRWRLARLVARQAELAHLVALRTRELALAKEALEEMNTNLEHKVAAAVDALRSAERMAAYGHTVAGVAHEVRQPLFALSTATFLLGQKLRDRPELVRDVQGLERETRRMNRVMEELLEFAKPRELLLGPAAIEALVREAVEIFRAEHDPDATTPLELALAPDLPAARVDVTRLQQVLVNLLHNAKKHAAGMTRVKVGARVEGERVVIEVADDGRGIAPADLPRVFEPFFTTGGTGLGLAITRRIVEDHGGAITVESGTSGTTFRVALPIGGPADGA
ncbi:MAG: hypothetical protein IT385_27180 [Deltaproteobacteria bacterium]|nr:hypothetical protein [Deltaproteobacteria bacterium]